MNARKRARRRAEREHPTYVIQGEYRPDYPDPVVLRVRAMDGLGRWATVAITREQAVKIGLSVGVAEAAGTVVDSNHPR